MMMIMTLSRLRVSHMRQKSRPSTLKSRSLSKKKKKKSKMIIWSMKRSLKKKMSNYKLAYSKLNLMSKPCNSHLKSTKRILNIPSTHSMKQI